MTTVQSWIGTQGPFEHNNEAGATYPTDASPISVEGFRTTGQGRVETDPSDPLHVVRLKDILVGRWDARLEVANLLDPVEVAAALADYDTDDFFTVTLWQPINDSTPLRLYTEYIWDASADTGAESPYRCTGKTAGLWVSRGPFVQNGGINLEGNLFPSTDDFYNIGYDEKRWKGWFSTCRVDTAPTDPEDVIRLSDVAALVGGTGVQVVGVSDLGTPAAALANYTGSGTANKLILLQANSTADFTLYAWATGSFSAASPYLVAGSSGYWAAIGGRYHYSSLYNQGTLFTAALTSSGAVSGTTGTFTGAVGVASLSSSGVVAGTNADFSGNLDADGTVTLVGNPAVFAYRSTAQTIPDNTSTTVVFATEVFDVGGGYNNTTGVFTSPAAGKYLISANVFWTYNTTGQRNIGVFVNETEWKHYQLPANSNSDSIGHSQDITCLVHCAAGDAVSVRVLQNSLDNLDIQAPVTNPNTNVTLSIMKVA